MPSGVKHDCCAAETWMSTTATYQLAQNGDAAQSQQALTPIDKAAGRRIYITNIVLAKAAR